jgi:site-specific DNA-methyltransferase (adenine-specific)
MTNPISISENRDCMEAMRGFPDKFFELAIVDPPYGDTCNLQGGTGKKNGFREYWGKANGNQNWNKAPDQKYFNELFRVSSNQIIWGGNHFANFLPASSGWIFWDKGQRDFSFSDGELAFSSFNVKLRAKNIHRQELQSETRQHPTQKPIKLYSWLLKNYAKPGDKILDTHLGSGSSRIAAYKMGFDFWGYEIDTDYWQAQEKRFAEAIAEPLFEQIKVEQGKLL